ncbi:AAEL017305-PA [Aedes aegypti]|nr:AAEL017305-PA [Aedes aegypti]DAA80416.1 TPA_exp: odorant receptor 81 [Aedes aegypti]
MEKVKRLWTRQEFDIDSDYFKLIDSICLLFEQRPPLTDRCGIKVVWTALSVFHGFQYICYSIQLVRCAYKSPINMEELTSIGNLLVVLTVAVIRGLSLAYHRDNMLELKRYVNKKSCRRSDPDAFALRKRKYLKINRYAAWFYIVTTMNSFTWAFTTGLQEDIFKIPYLIDGLSGSTRKSINVFFSLLFVPWCYTVWYSPTQFITLLSILHTELTIIVGQFEGLFHKVIEKYAFDAYELNHMTKMQINRFWFNLDNEFKNALSHHIAFVRKLSLLRKVSNVNFFIFLCSSTLITTFNIFLFLVEPSLGRVPLLLMAIQYISETYLCCTMFNNLENENDRINYLVYARDWLNEVIKHRTYDRPYCASIFRNAIFLHQQVGSGLTIRAGGIFPLNLRTFTSMMKSVYSLLTLLLQSIEMKPNY